MPEPYAIASALVAGGCASVSILATRKPRALSIEWPQWPQLDVVRDHLAMQLERAGWRDSPERVAVLTTAVASGLAALGLSTGLAVDPGTALALAFIGAVAGFGVVAIRVRSAVSARRRRFSRELAPLLELFLLELSGGGSA